MTDISQIAALTLEPPPPSACGDLDMPALAVAMSRRLYAAGLPISPERAVSFADALNLMGPVSRDRLYCTARTVFVSDPAHVPAFDQVFASVFGGSSD